MITFDLICGNNHTFEGWFEDGDAFKEHLKKGMIACPVCNDISIVKAPSSFAIKSAQSGKADSGIRIGIEKIARSLNEYVKKNFDDVGCDFADEALKIHYGVSEKKNIRGTSTLEEEKKLKKEGINFLKIPMPETASSDPE